MAGTYRQEQPGVSPSRPGRGRQRLLRRVATLCVLAATAALVAACGSSGGNTASSGTGGNSSGNGSAAAANATVSTRQLSGVGTVLVTSSGRTIYTPKVPSEVNGNIKCTGSCLSFWFPVTTKSVNPGSSGLPGTLGTIHLAGGTTQLTYNGRPLYTFRLDTAPGQAHGNNFTDHFNGTTFTWQAVTASGEPGGAGSPAPSPSYNYSTQSGY